MDASIELYEINRSIIEQQGTINPEDYLNRMDVINQFVEDTKNGFYMLYGKEIGYFTLFMKNSLNSTPYDFEDMAKAIAGCLMSVGPIYSIELTANKDAIEIWVKDNERDLITCMYFFPYDNGIVGVK